MQFSLDLETTTKEKGNPFVFDNQVVTVGLYNEEFQRVFDLISDPKSLSELKELLAEADLLIGYNIKFDLLWLYRLGIDTSHISVWDCQAVEYKITGHRYGLESLNEVLARYSLQQKLDKVSEYWALGIDTLDIPRKELIEYNLQDVKITWELYKRQLQVIEPDQYAIVLLANEDVQNLVEMERNGVVYNEELAAQKVKQNEQIIEETKQRLNKLHNVPNFNYNSNDHLSCLLFGGVIVDTISVPIGTYKTGARKGELKFGNQKVEYRLKRKYKPDKKQALAKEGYYSTSDDWLAKLPEGDIIDGIRTIRKLTKENSTYLEKNAQFVREDGLIHCNFNNTVTATGRLSSARPNMQNQCDAALECFISRYKDAGYF